MHSALEEMRELIAEGDTQEVIDTLLPFLASQMGAASERRHIRRFSGFRDEVLIHSGDFARLSARRRKRIDDPEVLSREERILTASITELLNEVDSALGTGPVPVPLQTMAPELAQAVPEKVIGRGNLQALAWLAQGLAAGRPVCRVVTPSAIGTGFLLPGGKVVTNNHVVPDAATAAQSTVEFNYERDETGQLKQSVIYPINAEGFYTLVPPQDCSVLCVDASAADLEQWGSLSVDRSLPPQIGEPVAIIQHPSGGEKQIAVTANEIVAIQGGRMAYLTDTLGGSSGAPVFNDRWRVVALHRAGGALIPDEESGHLRANEGVLFSHLLEDEGLKAALGMH